MPELPEVETMVRGIRPAVEGRTIESLRRCRCDCRPIAVGPPLPQLARRVRGRIVTGVRRLAKRVVLDLSSGDALVVEPRMTGLMLLSDPPDRGHLRLEWRFAGGPPSLWFWDRRGLGTVRLYRREELERSLGPETHGPDAQEMTEQDWAAACARTARPIKVAVLDQKLASGIGNLYASEILHLAAIHPARPASGLTAEEIRRMAQAAREVLTTAILYEGSTLGDGTYRNALNQTGRYQNEHRVYGKADRPCPTCRRETIVRVVQAQRSTFFCPACQPAGRGGDDV